MIITPLVILALLRTPSADEVMARYADYVKAHPNYQVDVTATRRDKPLANLKVVFQRGKRIRFDAKSPKIDYTCTITEVGRREVDRVGAIYDAFNLHTSPGGFDSRLDGDFNFLLPYAFYATDFRTGKKPEVKYSVIRENSLDTLVIDTVTPMGDQIAKFGMESSGRMGRVSMSILMGGKVIDKFDWTLTGYRDIPALGLSAFTVDIPDTFVSFALPEAGSPLTTTESFPVIPNVATLFVVTDPSAPFASALSATLARLGKSVPVHVVTLKESKLFNALHTPLYPFFALVTPDGKVKANWMGYDRDNAVAFEKEVVSEAR